ncbi:hypothetical protein BIU88_09060 [Chlorobaculum limnaeum]|uniref:Uncharacterized protein n=1 Tax=Chlorobaculum limnaeum TaxID=274537 RepID=A0A1D8CZB2_CHLLM|nr:hypothetical protein [Chlorobaculum limnaeum]AOS84266.1 hypothetical protein BIU88_09060 [Chlorobaculum limnaeum]
MDKKNNTNDEYASHFENVAKLFPMLIGIINETEHCNDEIINSAEDSIDYLQQHIDDDKLSSILKTIKKCVAENCDPPVGIRIDRYIDENYSSIQEVINPNEPFESMSGDPCSYEELEKLNKSFEEKRKQYSSGFGN